MAHFAKIENNIVVQVIVAEEGFVKTLEGEWVQTSYNTRGGTHPNGKPLRYNFAGVGMIYDRDRDAFISQQPYPSWVLNEKSCLWEPPIPLPDDNNTYYWNEDKLKWEQVRTERDKLIEQTRWRIERHNDEVALGRTPTEPIEPILEYIQTLRDIPQQQSFPDVEFPEEI